MLHVNCLFAPCMHAYLKQKLQGMVSTITFPVRAVVYRKDTQLKCSSESSPGTDSYCLDATVRFFNITNSNDLPPSVTTAQKLIKEALVALVPGYP